MSRKDFSDQQKAEIYVLDRATCGYSGRNLWLLDHGADSRYISDWADHVTPSSRGGHSSLENAVCASWIYNYSKLDSTTSQVLLFHRGRPTPDFFYVYDTVPERTAANLFRFKRLHYSDWYFNRAIWRACLGISWLHDSEKMNGGTRSRDHHYYAKAAFTFLAKWLSIVRKKEVLSFEQRGLVPSNPSADQKLLLDMRNVSSESELLQLMHDLLPFHAANADALSALEVLTSWKEVARGEAEFLLAAVKADKRISPEILAIVETNFQRLQHVVWGE